MRHPHQVHFSAIGAIIYCSDRINFCILEILYILFLKMEKKSTLTKILAILGTILVWFPIQAPLVLAAVSVVQTGNAQVDYLMPAELFPVALAGGILLVWAAWRRRAQRKIIGWSLGIAIGALLAGALLTMVTGLASGETELEGFYWVVLIAPLAVYSLGLVIAGVGGFLLLLELFRGTA